MSLVNLLLQFLLWEMELTWACVSDVGQVLNVCFLVRTSIGLFLNKGILVALHWMVLMYLPLVLRQMKRYILCMYFFFLVFGLLEVQREYAPVIFHLKFIFIE